MLAIYKKELRSYFCSFIGFLFIGVTLFFLGLYFTVYGLMYGSPYFSYVITSVIFLFLISVPVLTMRILAEEKRNKTDQFILTAPVSVGGIVAGKYLALLTIFTIPTAILCIYPLILNSYGTVPLGEAYLSIFGFYLYGGTCIAIGMLISSLTESQVIAAVLSFGALFLGYMMSSISSLISSTGNLLTKLLSCLDMYTPFSKLMTGTLNVGSIVYFLSVTILVLFLTTQSIQKRRYSVSAKSWSLGAYNTGIIAAAVAVVVFVNMILGELPSTWTSIDLTSQKLFSLTQQTKEFLNTLEEDVTIYVMVREENEDTTLGQTLDRYQDYSAHITVEYVDPIVNPQFYTQYSESPLSTNSLIVVSDKRTKIVNASSIYESTIDYQTYSSTTTGYDGEGQITSALAYVTSDDMPKIYMTEGHGEYTLSSTFTANLTKENIVYESINLMNYDSVPEDAVCLMINAPQKDFNTDDKDKILAYLDQGGSVMVMTSYLNQDLPNFESILGYMGLSVVDGLIIEQDSSYYYQSPLYLLPATESTTYTAGIHNNYYIFMPYGQGIEIVDETAEGMIYNVFLSTSDKAFSKIDMSNAVDYSKSEGDLDGPFSLGVEASKEVENGTATMIVFGSSELFTDNADQMVSGANQMLFSNTVGEFADHEVSVSVPVKSYEVSTIILSQSQIVMLAVITTIILPLGCLLTSFIIWYKRRKR